MTDEPVPVEQRHREAAWPIRNKEVYKEADRQAWMRGSYDAVAHIQAFARFERDHLAAPDERLNAECERAWSAYHIAHEQATANGVTAARLREAVRFDGAALGTRMKLLREMRQMSLQAVADASGLTKSHVWEMEKGNSVNPTVNAVWGLSAALCVSPAMLLGLDDKLPPIDPVALRIAGIVDREIKRAVASAIGART